MATILGKRTRSHGPAAPIALASTPARATRSKSKRTPAKVEILDEESDTIVLGREVDGDGDVTMASPRTPKRARRVGGNDTTTTPTKSTTRKKVVERQPLSPQKVNSVFRASKPMVVINSAVEPPKTPRRRDREMPTKCLVPPPTTPRHRVQVVSKPMTPSRTRLMGTPTHGTPKTVITTAKALFARSMSTGKLIGREEERGKLKRFIGERVEERKGGCLYVSGPPGCGKSALLGEVLREEVEGREGVRKAFINCMALATPGAVYTAVVEDLISASEAAEMDGKSALEMLETLVVGKSGKSKEVYVVVLDELDHLLTSTSADDLLPTLISLSFRRSSRLILLGIANALDLTDRFLPSLKAANLTPQLLPFLPYTAPQISAVITSKLRSLLTPSELDTTDPSFTPLVHPAAITLLAKKIESASGDLRKAFDVIRKALELVEAEEMVKLREQAQLLDPFTSAPSTPSRSALSAIPSNATSTPRHSVLAPPNWTPSTCPRVTLPHISRAASACLAATSNSTLNSRILALNAHAKALLCVLVSQPAGPIEMKKLKSVYAKVAERVDGMPKLVGGEVRGVVERLEGCGMCDIVEGGKGKGLAKGREGVVGRVGQLEVLGALGGEGVVGRGVWRGVLLG